jgi:hypothetical protein
MLMLSIMPAAAPFWLFDEVADGDAYPVSDTTPFASTMSHEIGLACAPVVQAGVVKLRSATAGAVPPPVAGAVGVTDAI